MVRVGSVIIGGKGELLELPLIDVSRRRSRIGVPPGTALAPGDLLQLVRPLRLPFSVSIPPTWARSVVALVRILAMEDQCCALVIVLKGSPIKGIFAEKIVDAHALQWLPPRHVESSEPFLYSSVHGVGAIPR